MEEKILALIVLKASGKGYRLLCKLFALPSTRTLTNLLNKIPLRPGINEQLFTSLQKTVSKMKRQQDKVCILMFDELSIETSINYDKKNDFIVGVEDFGSERCAALADHANVFMLKGLFRQWKQPIVFTFSSGPIKSIKLKEIITLVIKECHRVGLEVVATVCDQGAANQAAINSLLEKTKVELQRNNLENRYFGFLVDGREIVPLYDVPHLFKGLRNNLLRICILK